MSQLLLAETPPKNVFWLALFDIFFLTRPFYSTMNLYQFQYFLPFFFSQTCPHTKRLEFYACDWITTLSEQQLHYRQTLKNSFRSVFFFHFQCVFVFEQAFVSGCFTLTSLITNDENHSQKRPAAVTDTFFASPGCPLTRDSIAENIFLGFKAEENDNDIDNDDDDNYIEITKSLLAEAQYDFLYCFPPSNHHITKLQNSNGLFFFHNNIRGIWSILGLHCHAMKNKNANHSIQKD